MTNKEFQEQYSFYITAEKSKELAKYSDDTIVEIIPMDGDILDDYIDSIGEDVHGNLLIFMY